MINNKLYIGKTEKSLEERWKLHIKDSYREALKDRPLYRAFNKYGIKNFIIELIEETESPEEREIYWISFYNTFKGSGYNATAGGEGRKTILIPDEVIINKFNSGLSMAMVSKELSIGVDYIRDILDKNGIERRSQKENIQKYCKKIYQINKDTDEIVCEFNSLTEAAKTLCGDKEFNTYRQHIGQVANGKRKTAYGFKWKFV